MDRLLPFLLPTGVIVAVALGVTAIGELLLNAGHDLALPVGLFLLALVTAAALFFAGGIGPSAQEHHS
ncbi:MAG: hypothetical protein HY689_12930 [Chloroflexi bacterium]|nr:hypothetical protein [Chloroflexota bacterium]